MCGSRRDYTRFLRCDSNSVGRVPDCDSGLREFDPRLSPLRNLMMM
ncbi:hypothetical protein LAh6_61 [Aeromonas phage LAh_6]|uniref:Uncharacterized protein n=1 Tax=Aeromonas phage LAh_6 TaxID=2591030 RepID=A0A514A045_9CAUD|nr:hypothetical protein HWC30_gp061 [Aeromonas phage LAh_6]QDH46631.1 hypothetical protein LAh6_61 [Aeromonas phage LAh_6]